ncbi:MAG: lactonase family protein [Pseudomonadota bacterium]|nr:lactonase family protein [Pseudomonadota bacterium]
MSYRLNRRAALGVVAAFGVTTGIVACGGNNHNDDFTSTGAVSNVLYVESNRLEADQNSILAYARAADGSLTPLEGSPFLTSGKGLNNPTAAKLGPNDKDYPLLASRDKKRLFAVNSGSNTIAVFDIGDNGRLRQIEGSPFPSGGRSPVSLTIAGTRLYVVNSNGDADQLPNADAPNYTGFDIADDGKLTPIPGSTVSTVKGGYPSQVLASNDGTLLFGLDFLAPAAQPGVGSVHAFKINSNGTLTQPAGSPYALPAGPMPPLPLGMNQHPSRNILYVGYVTRKQIGVYTFDGQTGALTFVRTVPNSGTEICWIRPTANGARIYTVNNIDNSVSFYDNSDPLQPVEKQHLLLKLPGPLFLNDRGPDSFMQVTSTPYEPALAPDEKFLYVVGNRANALDNSVTTGNTIHILSIAADGSLSQPAAPLVLPVPVPPATRPQGLVVF